MSGARSSSPGPAPGEGERRAQTGFVAQYEVAAEIVLSLLGAGRLRGVGLADEAAGTLDDLQVLRVEGQLHVLDAYQVKWSATSVVLTDGEFRDLLAAMVQGRDRIAAADADRVAHGLPSADRVVAHLYTNRTPSTGRLGKAPDGTSLGSAGQSLSGFLKDVWAAARRGTIRCRADVPAKWQPYLDVLAARCLLSADELLVRAADLQVDVGRELEAEQGAPVDHRARERRQDLIELRNKLQDIVVDPAVGWPWQTAEALVGRLGPEWRERWQPRLGHEFPTAGPYEAIATSVTELHEALDRHDGGYVVLTGSPGCGKSTLLTRTLRTDDRRAASYYAYLPGEGERVARSEAAVFLHDLYLALAARRGRAGLAPRAYALDALREAVREELEQLGRRARALGRSQLVVIDGLNHVGRDPLPSHPLLSELPMPQEIPDGVLLVLGTRSLNDLPSPVRSSVEGTARHVHVAPLARAAVLRLCEAQGAGRYGERIVELAAGHPLLVRTYLGLLDQLDHEDGARALAAASPASGGVEDFYRSVWEGLGGEGSITSLLGLVCRLRGAIRPAWLLGTGTTHAEIAQLGALRFLFDTRDGARWRFFHSSFREFLLRVTTQQVPEVADQLAKGIHRQLAQRCRDSPSDAPERFDELYHLHQASDWAQLWSRVTVDRFRDEIDQGRPREDVQDELRMLAGGLAQSPDELAAVRLALAADEARVRGYADLESARLLELLVDLDQPELAVATLRGIGNTIDEDQRTAAFALVQALDDAGETGEALRVFERYEPLEWFGGPPTSRQAARHDLQQLVAWSRAAAQVRGPDYVRDLVGRLRRPSLDRDPAASAERWPARLLSAAAAELIRLERFADAFALRDDIVRSGQATSTVAILDIRQALHEDTTGAALPHVAARSGDIHAADRVELARALLARQRPDLAAGVLEQVPPPGLPETGLRDEAAGWDRLFAYWKLRARLGERPDPVAVIAMPEKDYMEAAAHAARHLVRMAVLEGRAESGDLRATGELVQALRALHSYWTSGIADFRDRGRAAGAVHLGAVAAARIARAISKDAVVALVEYFDRRWAENPTSLRFDGVELIVCLDGESGGHSGRALLGLEQGMLSDGAEPSEWLDVARAWIDLGSRDRARMALARARRSALTPLSDKDERLSTWIGLMAPLMHGEPGHRLSEALVDSLIALERTGGAGSPDLAASTLLDQVFAATPSRGAALGIDLIGGGVLRTSEVLDSLISATADKAPAAWWDAVAEVLVAIGARAPATALGDAARAAPQAAGKRLAALSDRVAIEGRPSSRHSWMSAIQEAARGAGIEAPPSAAAEAPVGPSRAQDDGARDDERIAISDLLGRMTDPAVAEHERDAAVRAAVRRSGELDDTEIAELEPLAVSADEACDLHVRLAQREREAGQTDAARQSAWRALRVSTSNDWSRHWSGGPALTAIAMLRELDDPARVTEAAVLRLSDISAETSYFLSSQGNQIGGLARALAVDDEAVAREAFAMANATLREVAPLPQLPSISADRPVREADSTPAFERLIAHLLASEQTVAWRAACRALLNMVRRGAGEGVIHDALRAAGEAPIRACSILAAASGGAPLGSAVIDRLREMCRSDRLDERAAAMHALGAHGAQPPAPAPARPLPPALRIELPVANLVAPVDELERAVRGWRDAVEELARIAAIDEDTLYGDVVRRARLAVPPGISLSTTPASDRTLGWGGLRPSARATVVALARVAAVLADADRGEPEDLLRAADLHPVFDVSLLRWRPEGRPSCVTVFVRPEDRSRLYELALDQLASGSAKRVARQHEGWVVLGEHSDVEVLDRGGHHEIRQGGLVLREGGPPAPAELRPLAVAEYARLGGERIPAQGVLMSMDIQDERPAWLGIHPVVAQGIGLSRGERHLDWTLDGRPAIRSIWWRSGYTRWEPNSPEDEVGEGWLVVGSPEVARLLARAGWRRSWRVATRRRFDESSHDAEAQEASQLSQGDFDLAIGGVDPSPDPSAP